MRIKEKDCFVLGIIDLLCGIACLITCIYFHRGTTKTILTFVPINCGVVLLVRSIETRPKAEKKERQRTVKNNE